MGDAAVNDQFLERQLPKDIHKNIPIMEHNSPREFGRTSKQTLSSIPKASKP